MKKCKRLRWLLQVNIKWRTGLVLALFFFNSYATYSQTYFNKLYTPSVGTYSVLCIPEGYFLPAQIQPGNAVGIATMHTDSLGNTTHGDTTLVQGYALFPRLAGSSVFFGKNVYFLGGLQSTPTDGLGVLFMYNSGTNLELARYMFEDTVAVNFRTLVNSKQRFLSVVGYIFKYTGGQYEYQRQLLLMQLDTLGNKIWERSYSAKPGLWDLQGNSIISTQDSGYAIAGSAYNYSIYPSYTSYVLITDSLGNKIVDRYLKYKDFGSYSMGIQQKMNGNFLVAYGTTYLSDARSEHLSRKLIIEELDKNDLSTVWQKEYLQGYVNGLVVSRLIVQNDSTFLIGGYYKPEEVLYQGEYAAQLGYIFAITENGDSLWYRDYLNGTDKYEYNYLNDIAIAPDGGIVGAGRLETSNSPYTGGLASHVWLFKTDSIGCLQPGCDTVYVKPKVPITEFKVYPNPAMAGQDLIIELPGATSATATLYNAIGQAVFKTEIEFKAGVAQLSPPKAEGKGGIYILHLQTPNGKNYVEKLVFY